MRRAAAIAAAVVVSVTAVVLAAVGEDDVVAPGMPSLGARLDDVVASGVPGVLAYVEDGPRRLGVCPREVVDALQRRKASESAVGTEAIVEVERRR